MEEIREMTEKEQIAILIDQYTDLQRIKAATDKEKEVEYQIRATKAKLEAMGIVTEDLNIQNKAERAGLPPLSTKRSITDQRCDVNREIPCNQSWNLSIFDIVSSYNYFDVITIRSSTPDKLPVVRHSIV